MTKSELQERLTAIIRASDKPELVAALTASLLVHTCDRFDRPQEVLPLVRRDSVRRLQNTDHIRRHFALCFGRGLFFVVYRQQRINRYAEIICNLANRRVTRDSLVSPFRKDG